MIAVPTRLDQLIAHLAQDKHEKSRRLPKAKMWVGTLDASWQSVTFEEPHSELVPARIVAILKRFGEKDGQPVLFVHGATAWRGTFLEPNGGIVRYLHDKGFDVWTLDWRAAKLVTDMWKHVRAPKPNDQVPPSILLGTLDDVVEQELRAAVRKVGAERGQAPLLIGHCIGAAVIATAIARGKLSLEDTRESARIHPKVILSAIGLFYRGSVDTWLRAQERLDCSEQIADWKLCFEPPVTWPVEYADVFATWERTPYPHCQVPFCRRISSLFGTPFRPNDIDYIHDAEDGLSQQFGVISMAILDHCAKNVRRGWSGPFGESQFCMDDLVSKQFEPLQLRLITGDENQLWHRDSIDRMHAWLRREQPSANVQKRVFLHYGHQDLWWSPDARRASGVYEYIADELDVKKAR